MYKFVFVPIFRWLFSRRFTHPKNNWISTKLKYFLTATTVYFDNLNINTFLALLLYVIFSNLFLSVLSLVFYLLTLRLFRINFQEPIFLLSSSSYFSSLCFCWFPFFLYIFPSFFITQYFLLFFSNFVSRNFFYYYFHRYSSLLSECFKIDFVLLYLTRKLKLII